MLGAPGNQLNIVDDADGIVLGGVKPSECYPLKVDSRTASDLTASNKCSNAYFKDYKINLSASSSGEITVTAGSGNNISFTKLKKI